MATLSSKLGIKDVAGRGRTPAASSSAVGDVAGRGRASAPASLVGDTLSQRLGIKRKK